jgi:hypothetical protein
MELIGSNAMDIPAFMTHDSTCSYGGKEVMAGDR